MTVKQGGPSRTSVGHSVSSSITAIALLLLILFVFFVVNVTWALAQLGHSRQTGAAKDDRR